MCLLVNVSKCNYHRQLFCELLVLKCISYDEARNVRFDTLICTIDGIHKRKNYE